MPKHRSKTIKGEIRLTSVTLLFLAVIFILIPLLFFRQQAGTLLWFWIRPVLDDNLFNSFALTVIQLCLGNVAVFFFVLFMVAGQAIVPVNTFQDRMRTAWHLILYILGKHGIATYIRDGKIQVDLSKQHGRPALLVIDFNSALVLEEAIPVPSILRVFVLFRERLLITLGLMDEGESPRVFGPGLLFLRPSTYVHSIVDLRKQTRSRLNVSAYTRDGIEIKTMVSAQFSIGHSPPLLNFTFVGGRDASHLRLVEIVETPNGMVEIKKIRNDFEPELDEKDWEEIKSVLTTLTVAQTHLRFSPSPQGTLIPSFNARRVFSAAFSDALDENGKIIPWDQLPVKIGTDLFRQLLLEYNYDQLYGLKNLERFPLQIIRDRLRLRMRNLGAVHFRVVLRKDRQPLQEKALYAQDELTVSQTYPLTTSKVMRNAGIAVIGCAFGNLEPDPDSASAVYGQRVENWQAPWIKETAKIEARNTLNAMREGMQARKQTQEELVRKLRQVLEVSQQGEEAAALQLYFELEELVQDPVTQKLLPSDTMLLMRSINEWIRPPGSSGPAGLLGNGRPTS